MPVTEILLLRHGHRSAWNLDPSTGKYFSNIPTPTKLPADPPLVSHGVRQAVETGNYLVQQLGQVARDDRLRVYSSLFYRCLETLRPTVEKLRAGCRPDLAVRGERGIGEWFGKAWFEQPAPAGAARLKAEFFPWLDGGYESRVVPDEHGERIHELHDRLAKALDAIVGDVDDEFKAAGRVNEEVTLLLCGHAAQIIGTGRVLTGQMPEDPDEEDFRCYTCGISKFVRRTPSSNGNSVDWKENGGVAGGWDCVLNSFCGHLSQGEERGWHFQGDESFDSYGAVATGPISYDGARVETITDSNEGGSKL